MKKIHYISLFATSLFLFSTMYLIALNFHIGKGPHLPVISPSLGDVSLVNIVAKHLGRFPDFFEGIQGSLPILILVSMFLSVMGLIFFLISYEPQETIWIRASVEMICAIFTVALYLISRGFHHFAHILSDPWGFLLIAHTFLIFAGILLLIKHLFAKVRLGIFLRSTLIGMLRKPREATPASDDVKDMKDALGIRGLDAPWIHPTRLG